MSHTSGEQAHSGARRGAARPLSCGAVSMSSISKSTQVMAELKKPLATEASVDLVNVYLSLVGASAGGRSDVIAEVPWGFSEEARERRPSASRSLRGLLYHNFGH